MERILIAIADAMVRLGTLGGGLAMWLITGIVAYDVVARYFGNPTIWALEICTYLMIGIALTGAGDGYKHDSHFAVTVLVDPLPETPRTIISFAVSLASLAFFLILTYGAILLVDQSIRYGMKSATLLHVPLVYPQGLVIAGAVTLVLAAVLRIRRKLLDLRRTESD